MNWRVASRAMANIASLHLKCPADMQILLTASECVRTAQVKVSIAPALDICFSAYRDSALN